MSPLRSGHVLWTTWGLTRSPESISVSFLSLFFEQWRHYLFSWSWLLYCSSTSSKIFTVFVPLSYTACSLNNICIFCLWDTFVYSCQYILYVHYVCNKCFYMCKWAYLVFASIYSGFVYHEYNIRIILDLY